METEREPEADHDLGELAALERELAALEHELALIDGPDATVDDDRGQRPAAEPSERAAE